MEKKKVKKRVVKDRIVKGADYADRGVVEGDYGGLRAGKVAEVVEKVESLEPGVILSEVRRKQRIEELAYEGLESALTVRKVICGKCKGRGEVVNRAGEVDGCVACDGMGYIDKPPSERMIELVMSPKFPKTQLNLNAEVENLDRDDLFRLIQEM